MVTAVRKLNLSNQSFSSLICLGGPSITEKYRINEKIRSPKVRLIDENSQNLGLLDIEEALRLAGEAGLDLVEVSPEANPPVCRILDFGKLKYQQKKKTQQKVKPKNQQKEIRVRPRIGDHDIQIKMKQMKDFIMHGDKVQVTMNFRGREMVHLDPAKALMDKIALELQEIAKIDKPPKFEGRRMVMLLVPK